MILDFRIDLDQCHVTQYATHSFNRETPMIRTSALKNDDHKDDDKKENGKKGRPRSERSRKAILNSTNKLLLHMSVQELSIEAIAKKAKVGKTTIYRWWPNKTAVVMDALINQPGMQAPMPTPANDSEAVVMQLEKLIRLLHSHNGTTIAQLFSEAQASEKSQKIFENNFLAPLIDAIQYSIDEGKKKGEFRKDLNTKMAIDMLCGPIFFRLMAHPYDFNGDFQKNYPYEALKLLKETN